MTPEDRARLRIDWHKMGHPDTDDVRWAGLFLPDDGDAGGAGGAGGGGGDPLEPDSDVLILSGCGLRVVPPEVFDVEGVRMLMLGNQPLGGVPAAIARMTGLEQLDLTFTRIEALPDEVFRLPRLSDLYLQGSALRGLPASLAGSPLRVLTLDACSLKQLPDFGGQRSSLVTLSMGHCGLTKVPAEVQTAPNLIQLTLDHNPLTDLSALAGLRHLACLQLNGCGLTHLPRLLADLPFEEAFARQRDQRRQALARRVSPGDLERLVARPLLPSMGLTVRDNPFKDKALKAAARLADAEERTFALQDWCRQRGG